MPSHSTSMPQPRLTHPKPALRHHSLRGGRRRPSLQHCDVRAIEQSGQNQHWAWACEPEAASVPPRIHPMDASRLARVCRLLTFASQARRAAVVLRHGFMLASAPYFLLFPSLRLFSRTPHSAPADSERRLVNTCYATPHILLAQPPTRTRPRSRRHARATMRRVQTTRSSTNTTTASAPFSLTS
ncbi:hypothetical protein C8J57DRAFT_739718 [Mycena rebaudengoi]|nr:hypothetical protein C8J57DRAFT_739718 [Mycena rebaudengoi]